VAQKGTITYHWPRGIFQHPNERIVREQGLGSIVAAALILGQIVALGPILE
jgi:hypothetical protein